ncbi:MAG: DUF2341 domain-containing protein [Chitinivibrionales bacterium]|nr:DUF2341 domain-containing protein [Chitinivibrionales bacterium]MBD3395767.1 DUF2341 domain-containing protein [Chitinivibrionales bacterium]
MPIRSHGRCLSVAAAACLAALLSLCSKEHNPFSDIANARAVVSSMSFDDGDTVGIFGRDSIDIALAVAELVDSFSVHVDSNRLFTDSTVVFWGGKVDDSYRFWISFFDTGWHEIRVVTYRSGGAPATEPFMVYAASPLKQDAVAALFESPVDLSTPGVASDDVMYHWDFGRGSVFRSPRPETTVVVTEAGFNDSGFLWVSDIRGAHASPRAYFPFAFTDTVGPTILCVNEGFFKKDTIVTGSITFPLRVSITDRNQGSVYKATIDNDGFNIVDEPVYVKVFHRMDTLAALRKVVVRAIDNAYSLNETQKAFYLGYSDTAVSTDEGVRIRVLVPPGDSLVFNSRERYLFGIVENHTDDSVHLTMGFRVNSTDYDTDITIRSDSVRNEWQTIVNLDKQKNNLLIVAVDSLGDTVADTSMTLIYDAAAEDSTPPVIVEVTSDGRDADRLYTPDSSVHLRAVVFDEGQGISSVRIDGESMQPVQGGEGHLWGGSVALEHDLDGNTFDVIATDKASLADTVSVVVFRNHPPDVRREPTPPLPVSAGSEYVDTFLVDDGDGDALTVTKKDGPNDLTVDGSGYISWTPTTDDIGEHTITIAYTDQFEPQVYTYTVTVEDTADLSVPAFVTTEQAFPVFVEAGDTVSVGLSIIDGRGTPPYAFSAVTDAGVRQPWLNDTMLLWAPDLSDTGYQRLIVAVRDTYGSGDTLVPTVLVVPENRPCTLSVSHDIDTLPDGTLDLMCCFEPETLDFVIRDQDHPLADRHTVATSSPAARVLSDVDTAGGFRVVLDARAFSSGLDSIVVTVADRDGHTDSLAVRVYRLPQKKVILNTKSGGAGISDDISDFPILVRLDESSFPFSEAGLRGQDIRFFSGAGTPLPYEIERFSRGLLQAEIWVLVPEVKGNNDTQYIVLSWGDSTAQDSSDGAAVFDTANGFAGVWHLSENGSSLRRDATAYGHHGTPVGYDGDEDVAGVIARADSSDSTHEYLVVGDKSALAFLDATFTFSAWVHGYGDNEKLFSKQDWGDDKCSYSLYYSDYSNPDDSGEVMLQLSDGGASTSSRYLSSNVKAELDTWNHIVAGCNGSQVTYCINGECEQRSIVIDIPLFDNDVPFTLMTNYHQGEPRNTLRRTMDEARVSNMYRSPAWMQLSYENQKPGSTFITIE